jgi:hypothetical protein
MRDDLFDGVVVLEAPVVRLAPGDAEGALYSTTPPKREAAPLTAIPYYLWANREPGSMLVWVPEVAGVKLTRCCSPHNGDTPNVGTAALPPAPAGETPAVPGGACHIRSSFFKLTAGSPNTSTDGAARAPIRRSAMRTSLAMTPMGP